MATLQDITKQRNIALGWDPTTKNVTVGTTVYTPEQLKSQGLTLENGRWSGREEQLMKLAGLTQPTTTVEPPTTMTSSTVGTPQNESIQAMIDRLKAQTIQSGETSLNVARQAELQKLLAEREATKTGYAGQRSAETTASTLRADRLSKLLRDQGYSEGTQAQSAINENAALAGNIGALKTAEQGAYTDIGRRETAAESAYQSGLQKLRADAEAQAIQNQITEKTRLEDIARQQEQIDYDRQQDATAQERSDFQTTIAANYTNISKLRDQLIAEGAPQWKIDMAQAAVLQKRADLNLDEQGNPLPVDTTPVLTSSSAALDLWKQLGTANQAIANALGVNVGDQYRNFSTRSGGGTTTTSTTGLTPKETISLTESTLRGTSGNSSADIMVQMNEQGYFDNLTPSELKTLMNKFGVTELMLEQAENRATIPTQGIPLPSQMGGLYGNFNNRQ